MTCIVLLDWILGLLNNASSAAEVTSIKWWIAVNSHLERIQKAATVISFQVLFRYLCKRLWKTMKNVSHDSQFEGWYLNLGTPKYKKGVSTI
jgi:hypothetical protein